MSERIIFSLILSLFITLMTGSMVYSADTATVMGKVTGVANKPMVKVTVSIGDNFKFTDSKGRYRLKGVPFGRHTLVIKKGKETLKEVEISINKPRVKHDEVIHPQS